MQCGCSIYSVHSTPDQQSPDGYELFNAKLQTGGMLFYLDPINKFTLRNTWYESGNVGIDRDNYYPEKPAPITYFLVELLVDPIGTDQVKVNLSSMLLQYEQHQIRPIAFWKERELRWTIEQRKKSKRDLYLHGPLCNAFGRSGMNFLNEMQDIAQGLALNLDPKIPNCFILKFPIEPIDPRSLFSVNLSNVATVNGQFVQLSTINYRPVQTKFLPKN